MMDRRRLAAAGGRLQALVTSRWVAGAGAALFVLSIPVALVGTNVRYLFGEGRLYTYAIDHYDAPTVTGIPRPELVRATREIRAYLFGPDEYLRIEVTDDAGRTGPLLGPREVLHMADVRRLVQGIFRAQEAALVVVFGYPLLRIALDRRHGPRAVARLAWRTALGFNLVALAFCAGVLVGFDQLFTRFHELSFSNDLWQLDPRRDHLVQMFPLGFWQLAAGLLVGMTLVESALIAVAARLYLARAHAPAAGGTAAAAGTSNAATTPAGR
jgi:integral membrane protein (TIGR01906 family)